MKNTEIIEKIYKRCSKRIKDKLDILNAQIKDTRLCPDKRDIISNLCNKISDSKIKYSDIYPDDPKLISRIINCKLTKNNPYLLTDNAIENTFDNEKLGLLNVLKFSNIKELLWGSEDEINDYIKEIYDDIIMQLIDNKNYGNFILDDILIDYVDFAFYSAYHTFDKLIDKNHCIPLIYYGMTYDEIDIKYFNTLLEASERLYKLCKNDFKSIFNIFIETFVNFKKLDTKFEETFVKKMFIPMLEKYKPNIDSLGYRVKKLVENDFKHIPQIITNSNDESIKNYNIPLFEATCKYMIELSKLQKNKSD